MKRLVDASAWIEFLVDRPLAGKIEALMSEPDQLVVPTITLAKVQRWVLREYSSTEALTVVASMRQGFVVSLDEPLAVAAAEIAHRYSISLSRSVVYAVSVMHNAKLFTLDRVLGELPGVVLLEQEKVERAAKKKNRK